MNAMTDSELRDLCFTVLVGRVGPVNAERFIALMNREPRDYTRWREGHFPGERESIRELGAKIMEHAAASRGQCVADSSLAPV